MFFSNAASPIFSVSGSDGKSTTTELAERILKTSHSRVFKSGNCGAAMTPSLKSEDGGVHIVELSSFMLEYFTPRSFSAVMTSLSENHLDWHGTKENYFAAKKRLFKGALHKAAHFDTEAYDHIKDEEPTTLISASDTERTLLANGATHTVTLRYAPREYKIGRVTGAIGLVLLAGTLAAEFVIRKYRKKEEE